MMTSTSRENARFVLGQSLSIEDTVNEYKAISGGRLVERIADESCEYAVGFLNSKGGSIYWGVTNVRVIEGVELNQQNIDELQNKLTQKLSNIHPIPPSIHIKIHEVYRPSNEKVPNLCIVEVQVPQGDPRELYSKHEKGDVFRRDNTVLRNLGKMEIYEEIRRRRREPYLIPFYPGRQEMVSELISKIKFANSMVMPLFPPIAVNRVHCNVAEDRDVYFAPPLDLVNRIINSGDSSIIDRFQEGQFSLRDRAPTILNSARSEEWRLFHDAVSKIEALEKAKVTVFQDYMTNQNTIKFNGRLLGLTNGRSLGLGLSNFRQGRTIEEYPTLSLTLFRTDYYSYRVMSELFSNINMDSCHDLFLHGLSEYLARFFQQGVHLGGGVAIILHTLSDNRLVLTRRSANSTNTAGEAGKLFMSANEGFNARKDIPDGSNRVHLMDVVCRALREELLGGALGGSDLQIRLQRVCVTGAYLYKPTFSVDLCVYAAIDCSLTDIRTAYITAPDGLFETSGISECPTADWPSLSQFISKTVDREIPSATWDEGALSAFLCAALCLPD